MKIKTIEIRFISNGVYKMLDGPYDEDAGHEYDCLMPAMDDNGQYSIVDCWVTDSQGNVHPDYNISPVPVHVDNIGHMVAHCP